MMRTGWFFNALIFLTTSAMAAVTTNDVGDDTDSPSLAENVTYVSTENFKTEVLEANLPVLVDFTATWCAPCKELDPIIESLMPEMSGRAKVFKLDIDESREIFTQYGLTGVPTVLFFNNGKEEDRINAPQSREVYVKYLEGMIEGTSAMEVKVTLLDVDSFRRDFILSQKPGVLEATLKHRPNLLTENFKNGLSPISLILNSRTSNLEGLLKMLVADEARLEFNPSYLIGLGQCDKFKALLEEDPEIINRPDPDGNTPLLTALLHANRLKDKSCVRAVLDSGADPGIEDGSDFTLSHAAVLSFDAELLEELLTKGLNPENTDQNGRNSLHWAAYYGYPETVKVLLDYGVDPSIQALNGETAADIVRQTREPWLALLKDTDSPTEALVSVVDMKNAILSLLETTNKEDD